jgi:hypothetical protein
MSRENAIAILGIFKTAYPRFYINMTKGQAEDTIALWQEMLSDIDIKVLIIAVKSLISHFEYPPTISDVRKEVLKLTTKKEESIDYWNEAYKMICNGIYMPIEEFEKHSDIVKRYFGSLERLKRKSMTEDPNMEVEQSLFNQYCKNVIKENETNKITPQNLKLMISNLSEKLSLKE